MKIISLALYLVILTSFSPDQNPTRKEVAGTYIRNLTEPRHWIKNEDGSEMEVAEGPSDINYLHLKENFKIEEWWEGEMHVAGPSGRPTIKQGTWELKSDTVIIHFSHNTETYIFSERCDLLPLEAPLGWSRESPVCK